jgi:predicted Zn-dependent peptidase
MVVKRKYKGYDFVELDNGLTVVLKKTLAKNIVARTRVNFGSINEKDNEKGLIHLLEHAICESGTKKYSPEEVIEIREGFGYFDASVNLGRTFFNYGFLPEYFETYLDLITESLFNPRFDKKSFENQKQVVLRELSQRKGKPNFIDSVKFKKALYREHPARYSGFGKEKLIEKASVKDMERLHLRGYHPNNMEIIIAGNLSDNIEELITKYFENFPPGQDTRLDFPKLQKLEDKTTLHTYAPDLYNHDVPEESSSEITLGWVAPHNLHPDYHANFILCQILGNDENSRLFKELRTKKGLVYGINTDMSGAYNTGVNFVLTISPSRLQEEVIDNIFREMNRIRRNGVTKKETKRIKDSAKYEIASYSGTNMGAIQEVERILDLDRNFEDIMGAYDKITPEDVQKMAEKYHPQSRDDGKYVLWIRDPLKKD